MPYDINRVNNKYELRLKDNNKLLGTHKTKKEAEAQIKAIEAQKHNPSKVIEGYRIFKSEKPNKKLKVKVNDKWVHFGNSNYQHFFDKTGLLDKDLNHLDNDRRRRYLKRASKIVDGDGNLTLNDKNSPNFWSIRILW